jgi:hypothetical protein
VDWLIFSPIIRRHWPLVKLIFSEIANWPT